MFTSILLNSVLNHYLLICYLKHYLITFNHGNPQLSLNRGSQDNSYFLTVIFLLHLTGHYFFSNDFPSSNLEHIVKFIVLYIIDLNI